MTSLAARWKDLAILERAVDRPAPSARTAPGHSAASRSLDGVAELFRTAFDEAPIGMCLVAPDGRFLEVNAAFCSMMGYPPHELVRLRVADITHADDRRQNLALLGQLVDGTLDRYEIRKTNVRRDGSPVPVLVNVAAVRDEEHRLLYIVAQLQDLTRQLDAERALRETEQAHRRVLERQARQDSLTGLPNRRDLLELLDRELGGVARGEGGAAVLFCDLDNFKAVNDAHGHALGDELLVAVAQRLRDARGARETVGRFGGDEFVVLAGGITSVQEAAANARRFAGVFAEPFSVGGRELLVTVSIGVDFAPAGARRDGTTLLRNADTAMYRAKALGRNRVVPFTEGLRRELLDRLELEAELRSAIARQEFLCHYQPMVDLATRRVSHVEALVRWQHPARGLLAPGAFLAGIERAGFAGAMGQQVMATAAAQAGEWHRAGLSMVTAVNLASQQLTRSLPGAIARLAAEHSVPAGRLCLELTETVLLEAASEGVAVLHDLVALGVRLAIDDFGTGYSSFAYMRDLPVHEVKLDISFINDLGRNERDARVVAGMIRMAHELGLRVVAEGVEQPAQLDALLHLGCDAAQGFLFARPSEDPLRAAIAHAAF
jgi:diguanylate cyclase (GGDEF)-like protein/PAS domain S-box-containing protein